MSRSALFFVTMIPLLFFYNIFQYSRRMNMGMEAISKEERERQQQNLAEPLQRASNGIMLRNVSSNMIPELDGEIADVQVHFRTYGSSEYEAAKDRITREAHQTGWFKTVLAHGLDDLPTSFREKYAKILNLPRGGGYWIWKVAVLEMALVAMNEGSFLVFADAGCEINVKGEKRFIEYLKMINDSPYDIISFRIGRPEHAFTTERIFETLNVSKEDTDIRDSSQFVGGVLIMQKGDHLRIFLHEFSRTLEFDPWLFTDKYNDETKRLNNSFVDNRHDQSVSSVIRKLIGSILLSDETYPPQEQFPIWATRRRKS